MRSIPVGEFKDNASTFIAAAEAGEEIIITRHGKPAARLMAAGDPAAARRAQAEKAFAELARIRERMRAEGRTATIEEMIAWKNEGRR